MSIKVRSSGRVLDLLVVAREVSLVKLDPFFGIRADDRFFSIAFFRWLFSFLLFLSTFTSFLKISRGVEMFEEALLSIFEAYLSSRFQISSFYSDSCSAPSAAWRCAPAPQWRSARSR